MPDPKETTLYNWFWTLLDTNKATLDLTNIYKERRANVKHNRPCAKLCWSGIDPEDNNTDAYIITPIRFEILLYTRDKSTPEVDIMTQAVNIRNLIISNITTCTTVSGLWHRSLHFDQIQNGQSGRDELEYDTSIAFSIVLTYSSTTGT